MYEILTRYAYQRTLVMGSGPAIGAILVVEWNDCGTLVVVHRWALGSELSKIVITTDTCGTKQCEHLIRGHFRAVSSGTRLRSRDWAELHVEHDIREHMTWCSDTLVPLAVKHCRTPYG